MSLTHVSTRAALALVLSVATLAGCGLGRRHSELECMERAMFFESNRSSRDGMIAVGSVVMNRVESGRYPRSVCGVVGQKNQFAPGIMTRKMNSRAMPDVREAARAVMHGERHPLIGKAMFFHAASHRFGYDNMHYVLTAGGNAFYERRDPQRVTQPVPLPPIEGITRRR
ncbi:MULTISPECIES: cell wall hydrolase [unclassified Paracoccus (in: a-proteobacteria)]|uniref:cell wall hydrolase n=1 Tax=unclassified Paracoccus (in: a-proteobacteria) TaxID=2688777 RepID=UPI0012B39010|nr:MULTISPECIES: cell wall hydrolase [unclassified Paracoccus (in: a-proteobacteria)]UXU73962.1 cell wall hydrolase [Paracoccus sp. SMMA_5]UXU79849.1 cell wall hydrolase [Paracoccus sp. SMMA_5_TC]